MQRLFLLHGVGVVHPGKVNSSDGAAAWVQARISAIEHRRDIHTLAEEGAEAPMQGASILFGYMMSSLLVTQTVAEAMHGPAFRAYTGDDMVGAELGGAMKNVLAVATGVADGMQLGLNARAGLITRGLNEMLRLSAAIGAKRQVAILWQVHVVAHVVVHVGAGVVHQEGIAAVEQLDVSGYDLVISSSHAVAKGVLTGRSPTMMSGYKNQPEKTREMEWRDEDGNIWLKTSFIQFQIPIFRF